MTRNPIAWALAGTLTATAVLCVGAPQAPGPLEAAFASMDKAAITFKGLTADLRKVSYNPIAEKEDVEAGTITVKRFKPADTRFLIKFTVPTEKLVFIGDGKFRMFTPKSAEAQEGNLGASKDLVNQGMLLGFGSNSSQLKAAYTVKLGGPEAVNGEKTTRLEAVPKDPELLKHVKRCDLWISENGIVMQQKFYEPGGDYVLNTYTNMKMAPNLPESAVKLDIPKGIKVTKLK
jgi:outer membrane lipoprotein-sorting protein